MVFWWYFTTQFDPEDEYRAGCRNVSHCQPQSYSDYVHPDENTQPTYCSSLRREDGRNLKSSLKKILSSWLSALQTKYRLQSYRRELV